MQLNWTEIESALNVVRQRVRPTPAYSWPQMKVRTGVDIVVKHENHTPTGSFKARGGLVFVDALHKRGATEGLVTATRGNHGQSIAMGASSVGIKSLIVVPQGNSIEKNAAMKAFGGALLEAGEDFDEARRVAAKESASRNWVFVPSFHRDIVRGVSTYALELFTEVSGIDTVFVPIGMGSGICGLIAIRDLLSLKTKIVGVVADQAPAFALSYQQGTVRTASAATFADGLACREPQPEALEIILKGAADVVRVTDQEIADAIREIYETTHNLAEGAGAAAYAAAVKHRGQYQGKKVGVILSGGNIDRSMMAVILAGATPSLAASSPHR